MKRGTFCTKFPLAGLVVFVASIKSGYFSVRSVVWRENKPVKAQVGAISKAQK